MPPNSLARPLSSALALLLLLVWVDLSFIAIHLVHELTPFLKFSLHSLQTDRGYSEVFQYVKTYWIILLLMALFWRNRQAVFGGWIALFTYLLSDDVFQIHEKAGRFLARNLNLESAFGLRGQDFGEMAVSALAGLILGSLVLILHLRSSRETQAVSKSLAWLFGALVFFGVGVDMAHVMVGNGGIEVLFSVLEDGGELLTVSVICWYVFTLMHTETGAQPSLRQLILDLRAQRTGG